MKPSSRLFFAAFTLIACCAHAQIQNEPTEVVTAPAPAPFSERSGLWPADRLSHETFDSDRSSLTERWNTIPGVQARESGSPTLSIRGSAQADRVLKLFDGAPLNMGDGVGATDLLIPSEVMSGVSLMKGPASVFYGPSAMAGVVDHSLRYFDETTLTGSLADAGGQFGDSRAALIVPFRRDHKTVGQVSVLTEKDPGRFLYRSTTSSQAGRRDQNSQTLLRATAATDLPFGDGWLFSARVVEAKSDGETPGSLYYVSPTFIRTAGSLATAQLSRRLSNATLVSLRLSDVRIWGDYFDESFASRTTSFASRTSLFADLNVALTDALLVKSFADLSTNKLTASYTGDSEFNQSDADLGQSFELALSPELSVQPAYRYSTHYGQIFKSFAAILSTQPVSYSFKIGEGFRAPSLSDRFGNFGTFRANPSLKPEREWSAELGASYESGRRYADYLEGIALKGSVFYTSYNDLVDTLTVGGTSTKINAGEARTTGAEASATYGYKVWSASMGYTYLDANNLTAHTPLRLAPRHQAVLTLAQFFGPFLIEAKETLWSSFYDTNTSGVLTELPSWQTFDLTFRTLALTDWELRGGVLNLFDESRELTFGYPEPQRRFFLAATRSF